MANQPDVNQPAPVLSVSDLSEPQPVNEAGGGNGGDGRIFSCRTVFSILIFVSAGLILGRIAAVDNIPDRAIQGYKLLLIPKQLEERKQDLIKQGLSEEAIQKRLKEINAKLVRDAQGTRPTLSANDRSRWLTLRALVEPESRVWRYVPIDSGKKTAETGKTQKGVVNIGQNDVGTDKIRSEKDQTAGTEGGGTSEKTGYTVNEIVRNCNCPCPQQFEVRKKMSPGTRWVRKVVPYAIDKAMETPGWDSIDIVKHGLPDEQYDPKNPFSGYIYSSKPTLLPTVMAVPYWLLYHTTGISLRDNPFVATRILLVIINLIPLVLAWILLGRMVDRLARTVWSKIFAMSVICFATFASTFANTLNNHLPGFVAIVFALYGMFRIMVDGETRFRYFILTGFFGAFAVACELPALALAAGLCLLLLIYYPRRTIFLAIPAGLVVAIAFVATNYIAHGTWKPAYMQKRNHVELAQKDKMIYDADDWYVYRYFPAGRSREMKNARTSHWMNRTGIDLGEPSVATYALHATIGHHGVFSLTPVWIFSMFGMLLLLFRRNDDWRFLPGNVILKSTGRTSGPSEYHGRADIKSIPFGRWLAFGTLFLTVLFFAFYLTRDQGDRNYGGMSCCFRWFFPLIPLWMLTMLPVLDRIADNRFLRGLALIFLLVSAMSAVYPIWNPWSHPWLYNLMVSCHWIQPF